MRKSPFIAATFAVPALAAVAAVAGVNASGPDAAQASPSPQRVSLVAGSARYSHTDGLDSLKPGWVTLSVRNAAKSPEGMDVVGLRDKTVEQARKLLEGRPTLSKDLGVELVSGPPSLAPGDKWEGTMKLTPGRYALVSDDDGSPHKYVRTFTVADGPASSAAPPKAVGSITMSDFRFGFHLPRRWNGKGVVRIPNFGRQIHEITFVKGTAAQERSLAATLKKGYPKGQPPKSLRLRYALGGVSTGETSYVRVNLTPGRWLAVCLFPDPGSMKPHTALGMIDHVTVR